MTRNRVGLIVVIAVAAIVVYGRGSVIESTAPTAPTAPAVTPAVAATSWAGYLKWSQAAIKEWPPIFDAIVADAGANDADAVRADSKAMLAVANRQIKEHEAMTPQSCYRAVYASYDKALGHYQNAGVSGARGQFGEASTEMRQAGVDINAVTAAVPLVSC